MKKRTGSKRTVSVKAFVAILALVLALGCAAGGTFAWLVTKTDPVVNTFTYGDINITLTETTGDNYKIIPGVAISKDPKVTVRADSEACWLFVKVEKTGAFVDAVTYEMADGWTLVTGETNVYYREVPATTVDTDFAVLKNNEVLVSDTLTKDQIPTITDANKPKLTITAYAIQKDGINDAATAWAKISTTSKP